MNFLLVSGQRLKEEFTKEKQTIGYEYDLGDGWLHKMILKKILNATLMHPTCIDGKNAYSLKDYRLWGIMK